MYLIRCEKKEQHIDGCMYMYTHGEVFNSCFFLLRMISTLTSVKILLS